MTIRLAIDQHLQYCCSLQHLLYMAMRQTTRVSLIKEVAVIQCNSSSSNSSGYSSSGSSELYNL